MFYELARFIFRKILILPPRAASKNVTLMSFFFACMARNDLIPCNYRNSF